LVVRVRVDDHVCAKLQARVETGLERRCEALVVGQADDVVDSVGACDIDRVVGRTIVDDQPLDEVEPRNLPRETAQRGRELAFLVETGNLDDQFH
jgi:hypothetical protein